MKQKEAAEAAADIISGLLDSVNEHALLDEEDPALVVPGVLEEIVTQIEKEHIEPVSPARSVFSPFRPVSPVKPDSSGPGHEAPFEGFDVPPVTPSSSHHSGSRVSNPVHTPVPVRGKSPFSSPALPIAPDGSFNTVDLPTSLPGSPFAGGHGSGLDSEIPGFGALPEDEKHSDSGSPSQLSGSESSAFVRHSPGASTSLGRKSSPRSSVAAAVDTSTPRSAVNTSLKSEGGLNVSRRSKSNTLIINGEVVVIPPVPQTLSPDADAQGGAPFPSTPNTTVVNTTKPGLVAGPAKLRTGYDSVQSDDLSRVHVDRAGVGFRPEHETLQTVSGLGQGLLQSASGHNDTLNLDDSGSESDGSFIQRQPVLSPDGDDLNVSKIEGDGDSGLGFVEEGDEELVEGLGSAVSSFGATNNASGVNQSALVIRLRDNVCEQRPLDRSSWDSFLDDESDGALDGLGDVSLVGADRSKDSWAEAHESLEAVFAELHKSGFFSKGAALDEETALVKQTARRSGVELDEDSRESSRRLVESIAKNTIFYSFINSLDGKTYYFAFDQFKKVYASADFLKRAELCRVFSGIIACRFKKLKFVGGFSDGYDFLPIKEGGERLEHVDVEIHRFRSLSFDPLNNLRSIFASLGESPRLLDDRYEIISDKVRGNTFQMFYSDVNLKNLLKRVLGIELLQDAGSFSFKVEIQDKPLTMQDFIKIAAMQHNKMYPFHYLVRKDQNSFDQSSDASRFEELSDE